MDTSLAHLPIPPQHQNQNQQRGFAFGYHHAPFEREGRGRHFRPKSIVMACSDLYPRQRWKNTGRDKEEIIPSHLAVRNTTRQKGRGIEAKSRCQCSPIVAQDRKEPEPEVGTMALHATASVLAGKDLSYLGLVRHNGTFQICGGTCDRL